MEKFLFVIREDLARVRQQTEEQRFDDIRIMDEWVRALSLSGNYLHGDGLVAEGRYVSHDKVLSDGPFIEAKEAINGYVFMQAKNIDQATAIAQSCPHVMNANMIIEIRPVMGLKDIKELGHEQRATGDR